MLASQTSSPSCDYPMFWQAASSFVFAKDLVAKWNVVSMKNNEIKKTPFFLSEGDGEKGITVIRVG